MRRRNIIAVVSAALVMPHAPRAQAQQSERMRRVGVLMGSAVSNPAAQARVAAFNEVLRQHGWIEGRNLRIDYRWSSANAEDIRRNAADFAAQAPDVVVATGSATLGPLLASLQGGQRASLQDIRRRCRRAPAFATPHTER